MHSSKITQILHHEEPHVAVAFPCWPVSTMIWTLTKLSLILQALIHHRGSGSSSFNHCQFLLTGLQTTVARWLRIWHPYFCSWFLYGNLKKLWPQRSWFSVECKCCSTTPKLKVGFRPSSSSFLFLLFYFFKALLYSPFNFLLLNDTYSRKKRKKAS